MKTMTAASVDSGFEEALIREMLEELVALPKGTEVSLDTETRDGLSVADNTAKVIGVSLAWPGCSCYIAVAHEAGENVSQSTVELLEKALRGKKIVFVNVQFDMIGMLHFGIDLRDEDFYDAPTMAMLVDENQPKVRSLDALGTHYCNAKKVNDSWVEKEKRAGNHFITPEQMWDYAVMDAELTFRVYRKLVNTEEWQRLQAETDVWPMKQRLIRILIEMRLRGIEVDTELTKELETLGRGHMARLREAMEFNPGSHADNMRIFIDQLDFPVIKKSKKTGKPSFDKEVMKVYDKLLERLDDNPLAKQVKEFRGWQKATTACYTPYLSLLGRDGRLHASFNTHRTVTGRLSSSEPNLQQVPKETDKPWNGRVKECFIAKPGHVLLSFDYAQLELRLGADMAQEASLLEVFEQDRDLFTEMAKELGLERPETKTFVYATNYGAGDKKIAANLGCKVYRAQEIRADYKAAYPGLARSRASSACGPAGVGASSTRARATRR